MDIHEKYMRIAINLAKRREGLTSPNPLVGAVIVKDGSIVGRGYHKKAGLAHAEINALREAGNKAKGATLYVTLEPCDHFGKTPPCTGAIIRSGIKKVVMAMKDPNPINHGRGIKRLRSGGIKTVTGILENEARDMNRPYIKFITRKMPYVTVKAAASIDGKIATRSGDSKWITSEDSRRYVHNLRSLVDAVMVGANTALKDDPVLLNRSGAGKQPLRIIVAGKTALPPTLKIFKSADRSPVIIAATRRSGGLKRREALGAKAIIVKSKGGIVDLKDLFRALAGMGIMHILVEGGGRLISDVINKSLADKFLFFIAPKVIGGKDAITSVEGEGVDRVSRALNLKFTDVKRFSKDILIEAVVP